MPRSVPPGMARHKYAIGGLLLLALGIFHMKSLSKLIEADRIQSPIEQQLQQNFMQRPVQVPNNISRSSSSRRSVAVAVSDNTSDKVPIAYAISVTGCTAGGGRLLDGAAVLYHSIRQLESAVYDSHLYAFVHPNATDCAPILRRIGYIVQVRDTPINVLEIQNVDYYKRLINPKSGCCAEKEFLKLYSYTLTDYPVVVHLDLDVILLKPLDELFDIMRLPDDAVKTVRHGMWEQEIHHPIHSMFTRDYPMSHPGRSPEKVGMQGGFWLVRPNLTIFEEFRQIILRGEFIVGSGWGGPKLNYGGFYGAAQIQGIVPYFYGHYHPNTSVELNRCVYNQMVDVPFEQRKSKHQGQCMTGEETCEDCRNSRVSDIYSVHFTLCQKPWSCPSNETNGKPGGYLIWLNDYWQGKQGSLCVQLHHEWHRLRHQVEVAWKQVRPRVAADEMLNISDYYYGHCERPHPDVIAYKYKPMEFPAE